MQSSALTWGLACGVSYHQIRFDDFAYDPSPCFFSLYSIDEQLSSSSAHFKTVLVNAGKCRISDFGNV